MTHPLNSQYFALAQIIFSNQEQALIHNLKEMSRRGVLLSKISVEEALATLGDVLMYVYTNIHHLIGQGAYPFYKRMNELVSQLIDQVDDMEANSRG